jgi:enediyne biosynthesis protein E4
MKCFVPITVVAACVITAGAAEWKQGGGFRYRELEPARPGRVGFTRLTPQATGVTFTNRISEATIAMNRIMENGSGVALGDVDGDGWCDIYLTGLEESNRLYRNLGHWKFEDVTLRAGVGCEGQFSTGAVLADVDGDGDLDLLVNGIGKGTRLFMNDGKGVFAERKDSGLIQQGGSHSLALADADGDGDLDLYVTNYRTTTWQDRPAGETRDVKVVDGKPVVKPADRWLAIVTKPPAGVTLIELGEVDVYYRNDGTGRFRAVDWGDGTFAESDGRPLAEPPRDWGLSALFRDFTGDGFPDIYVCNDFYYSRDRIWINDGHGRFRAIAPMRLRSMCETAMAADIGDINRDGLDDLLVMDMLPRSHVQRHTRWENVWKQVVAAPVEDPAFTPEYPRNMLFLNRGDGTWTEIARLAGIDATGWSWSALFLDVDLDGYQDVLVTTGHGRDMMHSDVVRNVGPVPGGTDMQKRLRFAQQYRSLPLANLAFHNQGDLTFTEKAKEWGFDHVGVSHGFALADLDNDGDEDVVVNEYREAAGVYRNEIGAPRLAVRLRGKGPNTEAIGARVSLAGGLVQQSADVFAGGRYLSGDASMRSFAAGSVSADLRLEVAWRNGKVTRLTGLRANRLYEIEESGEGTAAPPGASTTVTIPLPLFEDVTDWLNNQTHIDASFDDYAQQPLLGRKLSHPGPGITWFDLNRDGWDDLIIGTGRGGAFGVFANREGRHFELIPGPALPCDQTGVLGWMAGPKRPLLLGANSSYDDLKGKQRTPAVRSYDPRGGQVETVLAEFPHDVGPIALGDYDADGDMDLFVGGRVIPGRYPEAASSRLYRNTGGTFAPDEAVNTLFDDVGLVNGAIFTDLNGDGYSDLVLACEWGPIRVFGNVRGRFVEQTKEVGLHEHTGWWQGVATGDFNGDGQMDILASNWGRNSEFIPQPGRPVTIWAGDLDKNGTVEVIEAEWHDERGDWAPRRNLDTIATVAPWLRGEYATSEAFGRATISEIFGQRLTNMVCYQAATLDSSLFIAKGGRFERIPLPIEAQFSAAFGVGVGDFNGDGREDAFLAQNFFPVASDRSRQDAGLGLLLLGDGKGGLRPLSAAESGIRIYGEQRGCALADFDGDGRLDLAVGQNRGPTRLFRNRGAQPALRVRLQGPAGNVEVLGTQLAASTPEKQRGLIREVRSGSGYLSQDSAVALLPSPQPVRNVWVRWPRGKQMTVPIPEGAQEIRLTGLGEVTVLRSEGKK